jgi:hypothetical protein
MVHPTACNPLKTGRQNRRPELFQKVCVPNKSRERESHPIQLRHTTPKITIELYAQAVSADQHKAHAKVVKMVVPKRLPQKLRVRQASLGA